MFNLQAVKTYYHIMQELDHVHGQAGLFSTSKRVEKLFTLEDIQSSHFKMLLDQDTVLLCLMRQTYIFSLTQ